MFSESRNYYSITFYKIYVKIYLMYLTLLFIKFNSTQYKVKFFRYKHYYLVLSVYFNALLTV